MSSEKSSIEQQREMLMKKEEYYLKFKEKSKNKTLYELKSDYRNNSPNKYFQQIAAMNISIEEKTKIIKDFHERQKIIYLSQQFIQSGYHIQLGSGLTSECTIIESEENKPITNITRSGRITKKPEYFTQTNFESNEIQTYSKKNINLGKLKLQQTEEMQDKFKKNDISEIDNDQLENNAVRKVVTKYSSYMDPIFNSLIENTSSLEISNDTPTKISTLKDSKEGSPDLGNSKVQKRKYEDLGADKSSEKNNKNTIKRPNNKKRNKFFRSKLTSDKSSDSEENVSNQKTTVNEDKLQGAKNTIKCPICDKVFSNSNVETHAANCLDYQN